MLFSVSANVFIGTLVSHLVKCYQIFLVASGFNYLVLFDWSVPFKVFSRLIDVISNACLKLFVKMESKYYVTNSMKHFFFNKLTKTSTTPFYLFGVFSSHLLKKRPIECHMTNYRHLESNLKRGKVCGYTVLFCPNVCIC